MHFNPLQKFCLFTIFTLSLLVSPLSYGRVADLISGIPVLDGTDGGTCTYRPAPLVCEVSADASLSADPSAFEPVVALAYDGGDPYGRYDWPLPNNCNQKGDPTCNKPLPKPISDMLNNLGIKGDSKLACVLKHIGDRESCMNPGCTYGSNDGIFQMNDSDRKDCGNRINHTPGVSRTIVDKWKELGCQSLPSGTTKNKCDALCVVYNIGYQPGGKPDNWGTLGPALKDCGITDDPWNDGHGVLCF